LIRIFEEFQAFNGIFFFLNGDIVNNTQDPVVVFKFIEAATQLAQLGEVERVCRDHKFYDPRKSRSF